MLALPCPLGAPRPLLVRLRGPRIRGEAGSARRSYPLQSTARDLPALREPQQELDVAAKPSPSFSRARNDACARYQAQSFAALKSKILRDDAAHEPRRGRVAAAPRTNRVEDALAAAQDGAAPDHDDARRRSKPREREQRPQEGPETVRGQGGRPPQRRHFTGRNEAARAQSSFRFRRPQVRVEG